MAAFLQRVSLINYKSIERCDVTLRRLTVIVGRNGSGKSNFLDSLHFIADALNTSLEYAIRKRGGIKAVTHRRGGGVLRIDLALELGGDRTVAYGLQLMRGLVVQEALTVTSADGTLIAAFERRKTLIRGQVDGAPLPALPAVFHDRLALVALSGFPVFREMFDVLVAMRFYRLDPDEMREPQDPDKGEVLLESGANLASVWGRLDRMNRKATERLTS